jgi:hypothetical protein
LAAAPAAAGPCTEQLNEVAKMMSNNPAMGAPTSGALAGAAPGAIQSQAPMPQAGTPPGAADVAGNAVKGQAVATTMAGNAPGSMAQPMDPAAGRATSPQDVRAQQVGQPTAAQGGDPTKLPDNITQAKNQLDKARMLDAQGSGECAGAITEAKRLMGS